MKTLNRTRMWGQQRHLPQGHASVSETITQLNIKPLTVTLRQKFLLSLFCSHLMKTKDASTLYQLLRKKTLATPKSLVRKIALTASLFRVAVYIVHLMSCCYQRDGSHSPLTPLILPAIACRCVVFSLWNILSFSNCLIHSNARKPDLFFP